VQANEGEALDRVKRSGGNPVGSPQLGGCPFHCEDCCKGVSFQYDDAIAGAI